MRAGRAVASIALAGAIVLGTSACTFLTPTATLFHYDPGNGVGTSVGVVDVRDAVALINEDGAAVSLLITLINTSGKPVSVKLQYESGGEKTDTKASVAKYGITQFGTTKEQEQLIILNPGVEAGGLFPVYVQYGDEPGKTILVPVLDGTLPEYRDLVPPEILRGEPAVEPTAEPTPAPTPTPEATEEPAEG